MAMMLSWRDGGGRPRLADEALPGRAAARQLRGQHLDGDEAVQLVVEGPQHDAHAALADDLQHLVMPQPAERIGPVGRDQEVGR